MTFGDKIAKLRKKKNMTQGELAKLIGADARRISMYEKAKTIPSTEVLTKLSEVFEVSLDYLVKDEVKNVAVDRIKDVELLHMFEQITTLDNEDKKTIKTFLNAFLTKKQLQKIIR